MATFSNQASLSYNGLTVLSNTVTGEVTELLTAAKNANTATYAANDTVTYTVALVNSGTSALTGLTVTDNLGAYTVGTTTVRPLTYEDGSLLVYVNGVLQTGVTVSATAPLTLTGINIPGGGDAVLVYGATANQFAPLATGSTISNTAIVSGGGLITPISATDTVVAETEPDLKISKSVSPATVTENGQLQYTFLIQNFGNTAALVEDNVAVNDTFDPILTNLTASLDGAAWTLGTQYTYSTATGAFASTPGAITVPAATFTQDPTTGIVTVSPGETTLVVTGTV